MLNEIKKMCLEINPNIPDDPNFKLIDHGLIDSFGIYMIIAQIEIQFGIQIKEDDMTYENFKDINSIYSLVCSYR